jgi:glycosyltransferase involved in cell wall biosynthesis
MTPEEAPAVLLTVVVPTRHEQDNAHALLARLAPALTATEAEVVVVDDSDDRATVQAFEQAATWVPECPPVRTVHRQGAQRQGALAGAVLHGIDTARGTWIVVMDGDLQHPPEVVPHLVARARRTGADVAVASRYCPGTSKADAHGLDGAHRRLVSRATGGVARLLFPRRVGALTDPMSGFFAVRRASLGPLERIPAHGFKILLAMLLSAPQPLRVVEVPFSFAARHAGETKATWRMGAAYGRQLVHARLGVR